MFQGNLYTANDVSCTTWTRAAQQDHLSMHWFACCTAQRKGPQAVLQIVECLLHCTLWLTPSTKLHRNSGLPPFTDLAAAEG